MKRLAELIIAEIEKQLKPQYPSNHEPAIRVPKGGSSCASCEYLGKDGKSCVNKYFVAWHGSKELPYPADEFCSDWYEPAKGKL